MTRSETSLTQLGLELPSSFLLSETRIKFLQVLRLLESVGAIDPDLRVPLPAELRRKQRFRFPEELRPKKRTHKLRKGCRDRHPRE